MRGSPWHAYRVDPLSTEREPEAHLDSVKLTMPLGEMRNFGIDTPDMKRIEVLLAN